MTHVSKNCPRNYNGSGRPVEKYDSYVNGSHLHFFAFGLYSEVVLGHTGGMWNNLLPFKPHGKLLPTCILLVRVCVVGAPDVDRVVRPWKARAPVFVCDAVSLFLVRPRRKKQKKTPWASTPILISVVPGQK